MKQTTLIKEYPFTYDGAKLLFKDNKGIDWPVVYILSGIKNNKSVAYVGETSSAYTRMNQHLDNKERKCMLKEYVLFNDTFNKSAILDIENMLIEHMNADTVFDSLQNLNKGQSKFHNYYQRGVYKELFKDIWNSLRKLGLAKLNQNQIENSEIFKYSPFKQLTSEQYDLELKLLDDVIDSLNTNTKKEIIIEGGAGTGKSVLAISLIKYILDILENNIDFSDLETFELIEDSTNFIKLNSELSKHKNISIAFVAPVKEFRETIKKVFKKLKLSKKIKIDVVSAVDLTKKEGGYDIVLVDEAHHLGTYAKATSHSSFKEGCFRLGFNDYYNTTQLDWVIKQAKYITILFYDRKQSTSAVDVKESDFISLINKKGNKIYNINNQIRLLAGEEYISYWYNLLKNNTSKDAPNIKYTGYEFKIYDCSKKMLEDIKIKDNECNGLCRVLSGYGFPFTKSMRDKKGKNAKQDYDFIIDGNKYSWNGINENYATDPKTVNLIGSVFTSQGYDLNYCGVIFSNDIRFNKETGKIECVPESYFDTHGKDSKDLSKTIEDIINSYLVLLTRGIKGTYIYCCDKDLRDYFKEKFKECL